MAAKYRIIANELELLLRSGRSGGKLPTEAELCRQYGCSRQTARSALGLLQEKGLIVRRQGSGSYPIKLPAKSSRQIAMLLTRQTSAPEPVREAQRAAEAVGCTLLCMETGGSHVEERRYFQLLLQQRPAGIILEPIDDVMGCPGQELLQSLRTAGVPLVYLGGRYDSASPWVSGDEAMGGSLLAAHLAQAGHRKIAAILKWDESRGIERFRGLAQGAEKAGILFRPENCMWYSRAEQSRLLEGDNRLVQRFLQEYRGDCTAVVCFDDEIAARVQRCLRQQQEKLALVSFDSLEASAIAGLALSGSLTAAAVAMLAEQITTGTPPASRQLPQRLKLPDEE